MDINTSLSNCRTNIANMEIQLAKVEDGDEWTKRLMRGAINIQRMFEYDLIHGHYVHVDLIEYEDGE